MLLKTSNLNLIVDKIIEFMIDCSNGRSVYPKGRLLVKVNRGKDRDDLSRELANFLKNLEETKDITQIESPNYFIVGGVHDYALYAQNKVLKADLGNMPRYINNIKWGLHRGDTAIDANGCLFNHIFNCYAESANIVSFVDKDPHIKPKFENDHIIEYEGERNVSKDLTDSIENCLRKSINSINPVRFNNKGFVKRVIDFNSYNFINTGFYEIPVDPRSNGLNLVITKNTTLREMLMQHFGISHRGALRDVLDFSESIIPISLAHLPFNTRVYLDIKSISNEHTGFLTDVIRRSLIEIGSNTAVEVIIFGEERDFAIAKSIQFNGV